MIAGPRRYDLADRLVSARVGNVTETYTWSGDGIRLSAATGSQAGKTVRFVVDRTLGQPSVVIERDGAGKTLRRYVYGLDLLSQTTPTNTWVLFGNGPPTSECGK